MATAVATRDDALQVRRERSARERSLRRVLRTPVTVIGLIMVIFLIMLALGADSLPVLDPNKMDTQALLMPPGTAGHPLGTDTFGRDILSRLVHGSRISLVIGITVVALSSTIGTMLGVMAGFLGGRVDTVIARGWDVLSTLPGIILYLVIIAALGRGVGILIVAMTIGGIAWPGRLVRERVLSQRAKEYVEAARTIGASPWRIMFRHVLPNCLTPLLVSAALAVPGVILAEAGLSYLGLGVPPPTPSWGQMISEGQNVLEIAPWVALIPGFFVLIATLGFNLVGDGLRDYLDPTQLR